MKVVSVYLNNFGENSLFKCASQPVIYV